MYDLRMVAAAVALMPSLGFAQAFDWTEQLGNTPAALEKALGASARCTSAGHSVPVRLVDANTRLRADLFDPVVNAKPRYMMMESADPKDLSRDFDDDRRFLAGGVSRLICTVGREASIISYSFEDRIFRISIAFDRCGVREERARFSMLGGELKSTWLSCEGVDDAEKDFDRALFRDIDSRKAYGYNEQGEPGFWSRRWDRFIEGEYADDERENLRGFSCGIRKKAMTKIPPRDRPFRCLLDVVNEDVSRWSAISMFEILKPGRFFDEVEKRLASRRLLIDMPAERRVSEAMLPELEAMVDAIKAGIADRMAAREASEGAVSNILGASD